MSRCFAALAQLHSIRRFVSVFISLIVLQVFVVWIIAMAHRLACQCILSVDYGRFKMRHAARLISQLRRSNHVTDALARLHWLLKPERITFKIGVSTIQALRGVALCYVRQFVRIADVPYRQRLRSATADHLIAPVVELSSFDRRSLRVAGPQICRRVLILRRHCLS